MTDSASPKKRPQGFPAFAMIWSSQIVSILCTGMSGFALSFWMYEQTKSATAMASVQVFFIVPFLIMSFFAGPMIDRYSRRLMMAWSDACALIGTAFLLAAFQGGFMQFWMIYAANIVFGVGNAFQWPSFSAAITVMVPKKQLGRVNGMMSLMEAGPAVLTPIIAAALLKILGINGILFLDVATYVMAIGTIALVSIPRPEPSLEGAKAQGNIFKEAAWGFKYIFERPSLLGLQLLFLACNFFFGIGGAIAAPMLLARSGSDALVFGGVNTAGTIGGVIGGLAMSAWGGFKKRTIGVVAGWVLSGLAGGVIFGLSGSFWPWALAMAVGAFAGPIVNASNQSIWQSKVPPGFQGRVFSARRLIAWISGPITPLIAGPLADFVLEPAMRDRGSGLSRLFGPLFGTGPGAGMGVLIAGSGLLVVGAAIAGWLIPTVRNAERLLPDFDAPKVAAAAGEEADPALADA